MVGKSGVEQTYDSILRGMDGSRDVIVNSHGKEVGAAGQELAIPGQGPAPDHRPRSPDGSGKANGGQERRDRGAGSAHRRDSRAWSSRPTFDPNQFSVRLTRSYWSQLINDPDHPLMNKAIQAQLAPGSTFKVIMSLAGLQEERRPGHARDLQRRRHLLRSHLRVRQAPRHGGHRPGACRSPATPTTTRWRKSWASTPSPGTPPRSASARRPASICPTRPPAPCLRPRGS